MSAFDPLHPALQHHIVNSLGWRALRPVQDLAIDAVLDGDNLIIIAPTAGGKTECAFFPLLSQTVTESWSPLSVLYVSPLRALLNNQEIRLGRYYGFLGRSIGLWHGDVRDGEKRRIVADPPDCLLTTPESLEVMLVSASVPHERLFAHLRAVVIDEAHAFASDDRGWHLLSLLSRIRRICGRDLQRIGLSATVGNPEETVEWLSAGSDRARRVVRAPGEAAVKTRVEVDHVGSLANAAKVIHALHRGEKRLVFVDSRARVEELASDLRDLGTKTFVSHGSLGVDERRQAETAFSEGQDCVIVATSALELGIDVGDLDRVVQIDAPATVSSFLQRMGRTGRRPGTSRNCLFLATQDQTLLRAAALVDLWSEGYVELVVPPPEPAHILAQQLMALALQEKGVGRADWFEWVRAVPAFREMPPASVAELVGWMVAEEILFDDQGILWFGEKGEKTYGRKNFLELFSVFTSPPFFTVLHGREDLGQVHESSFVVRQGGPVVLLLGGRSWEVKHVDWDRRIAHVQASSERGKSRWRGEGQFLSYPVCQAIRRILVSNDDRPGWSQRARKEMATVREDYAWMGAEGTTLRADPGSVEWWTFGGGKANAALATALEGLLDATAKPDNFRVRVTTLGGPTALDQVMKALDELRKCDPGSLLPRIEQSALDGLKFAACLPPDVATRALQKRMADPAAVVLVARGKAFVEWTPKGN